MNAKTLPALAISGLPASGKSTLAKMLSENYDIPTYSLGMLFRERYKQQYPNQEISFEDFWSRVSVEENRKVNMERKVLFESGDVIADSRYISFLDRSKCLLIFVTADIDVRVGYAQKRAEYSEKSREEVKSILLRRESDEARMGIEVFGVDHRTPMLYHVIINSGMLTPEEEFNIVRILRRMRTEEQVQEGV